MATAAFSAPRGLAETTVYVNQFFEVRDHDQPVKYVWNGETRVARVTGSLAPNARIQRIRLLPGWNLRSIAVDGARLPPSAAAMLGAAFRWSSGTRSWVAVSTNDLLAAGTVLWLHARSPGTVPVTGNYAAPGSQPVPGGGAFLAGSGLEALTLPAPDPAIVLWRYLSALQEWEARSQGLPDSDGGSRLVLNVGEAAFASSAVAWDLPPPDPGLSLRYYHQDHLGSSSVITDGRGELVAEMAYHPYGAARQAYLPRQVAEPYGFTQKERDTESGLEYFGRRFYSAGIGRWLTTDPMEEKGGGLNLYAYAVNNPLKYHDPDGAEIDVKTEHKKRETLHTITITAVIQDTEEVRPDKPRSPAELEGLRTALVDTLKTEYSGYDAKTRTRWVVDPKITVLAPGQKPGPKDHVIKLVGSFRMSGAGETRFALQPDGSKHRGMLMKVQVSAVLDARNDKLRATPFYKSPGSIAAHELGHAMGLDDLETDKHNLMSHGREHDSRDIRIEQLKTIVNEFRKGHLNKRLE